MPQPSPVGAPGCRTPGFSFGASALLVPEKVRKASRSELALPKRLRVLK